MLDPVMALALIALLCLAYLVGMALGVIAGVVWDSIKELFRRD
jgi:ABC-type antimicrobial peptide transport system permease subunit